MPIAGLSGPPLSQERLLEEICKALLAVGKIGHHACNGLDLVHTVRHGNTQPHVRDHRYVVAMVAHRADLIGRDAQIFAEHLQRTALRDVALTDLDALSFRAE